MLWHYFFFKAAFLGNAVHCLYPPGNACSAFSGFFGAKLCACLGSSYLRGKGDGMTAIRYTCKLFSAAGYG